MTVSRKTQKSVLMTPDPYHTPGYGGFCPQFKYKIGQTFGRTTSQLLTSDAVASSGKLVLAGLQAPPNDCKTADKLDVIRTRTQSYGDQKLGEKMVPGYTGFIPKSQHYFGKRYAENCVNAISDFEGAQRQHSSKIDELRLTEALQSGKIAPESCAALPPLKTPHKTPLRATTAEVKPYISRTSCGDNMMTPYFMDNENPHKRYMSGYTGFVPRSRGLLGCGYPLITHRALCEFTDDMEQQSELQAAPVALQRTRRARPQLVKVYPDESGLVPHYTGHIPGEKFRYGHTFGSSTKNALVDKRPVAMSSC